MTEWRVGLRTSLVCEDLFREPPGGEGAYVRAMLGALPRAGAAVEPVVAWHTRGELEAAGLAHARRLRVRPKTLGRRWARGRRPGIGGPADVVHAPTLSFPPHDGRPLVVTVHDVSFLSFADPSGDGHGLRERALGRIGEADLVIVPSKATQEELSGIDDPPERVQVVPMGTDFTAPPDDERDRVLDRLEVERPYVLWMGTIEPRKNPEGIVKGFTRAVESWTRTDGEVNLYIVGPAGWWPQELGEYVSERGLEGRIRRLGPQPKAYRAALYAGAEAFLFPSLAEGFGLSALEAMACGTPVVTSNRSSLPEVTGSAALLCDPTDPDAIGEALRKVLSDRGLAEDLRRLGLERAATFTWERTARETVGRYRELLE